MFDIALHGMLLYAISSCSKGVNIFASGLFTALSNGKVSAFCRSCALWLPGSVHFRAPRIWGVNGIWLAIPVAEVLSLAVSIWCLVRFRKVYHYDKKGPVPKVTGPFNR